MAAICAVWFATGITAGIYLSSLWRAIRVELPHRLGLTTQRDERLNAAERLRLRAAMQHNLVMRGDPRGVYGDYPPIDLTAVPVMPPRRRGTTGLSEAKLPQ